MIRWLITLLRPGTLAIALASWVHYTWAFSLFSQPLKITGIALSLAILQYNIVAGACYLIAGTLASIAVLGSFKKAWTNIMLLAPQQFLLIISAIGVLVCTVTGQFADGVIHPRLFIWSDQCWQVYLCILHAVATITGYVVVKRVTVYFI
jgi:hypothetical protein